MTEVYVKMAPKKLTQEPKNNRKKVFSLTHISRNEKSMKGQGKPEGHW